MDYRFQHIHKQEPGRTLERNIQSCGMQVIRGRNPSPPPQSCLESKNEQEVSVSVRELPPVASSYWQLQICRIGHLDSETRNEIEITHGFPLCPRTAFVQRWRSVLNEHGEEPAASYRWTGWSSRPREVYRYQHIHKEEQGRELRTKHSKVRNASYKKKKQTTTTTTKLP